MTVNQMLKTIVAGGTVSDADIQAAAYGVRNFEITCGPNAWDVCSSRDQLGAYWDALRTLVDRLDALTAKPPLTAEQTELVAREFQAADLEERAQNAEDREDLGLASRLRAQARALRSVKP
jgi:hypothetical protein